MSVEVIRETTPKAGKEYDCEACLWIINSSSISDDYPFTFGEKRLLVRARRERWRIQSGQVYLRQVNKFDGDLLTFRARPEIHALCLKYHVYEDI